MVAGTQPHSCTLVRSEAGWTIACCLLYTHTHIVSHATLTQAFKLTAKIVHTLLPEQVMAEKEAELPPSEPEVMAAAVEALPESEPNSYEQERQRNIEMNNEMLKSLGLAQVTIRETTPVVGSSVCSLQICSAVLLIFCVWQV